MYLAGVSVWWAEEGGSIGGKAWNANGTLSLRQVADLLGHSTSQIAEMYYVKKDMTCLQEITDGFNFKPESVAGGTVPKFPPKNILARVCQDSEPSFFAKTVLSRVRPV